MSDILLSQTGALDKENVWFIAEKEDIESIYESIIGLTHLGKHGVNTYISLYNI